MANNVMRNDTLVRAEGMKLLLEGLGNVTAEHSVLQINEFMFGILQSVLAVAHEMIAFKVNVK